MRFMKKNLLLTAFIGVAAAAFAQKSHPDKLPWVEGKLPPVKGRYEYKISEGDGSTLRQARDDAFGGVLVDLGNLAGIDVSSRSIVELKSELGYSAGGGSDYVETSKQSTTFNIKRQGVNVSLTKVGEYYEYQHGSYHLWELYEVSMSGPFKAFRPEYTAIYGLSGAWRSAILPGWGQFHKGKTLKGVGFLAGEAALATGALLCEMRRADSYRKSQETTNLAIIKDYRDRADRWTLNRNVALGAAAGLYLWNVLDAALAKGKVKYAGLPQNLQPFVLEADGYYYCGLSLKF